MNYFKLPPAGLDDTLPKAWLDPMSLTYPLQVGELEILRSANDTVERQIQQKKQQRSIISRINILHHRAVWDANPPPPPQPEPQREYTLCETLVNLIEHDVKPWFECSFYAVVSIPVVLIFLMGCAAASVITFVGVSATVVGLVAILCFARLACLPLKDHGRTWNGLYVDLKEDICRD